MNLNLGAVLVEKVQLSIKKKEIKKLRKELLKLKIFILENQIKKPSTSLRCIEIKQDMGWCDDVNYPKKYNKLFKINKRIHHEKLKRKDHKYDLLIPIKYNFKRPIPGKGSCILFT